ncbi:MAG: hypothetical protein JJ848_009495 [Prochlorococcus marinus CUG1439]|uniref:hypothetical protein n=1 Tax=Prochlorococcus sp. MIT 1314 TaxID=3096220 RepID=UPI002A5F7695|nr:hypothetical protein [Prochlorococcus sp. MIT 1314]MCR8540570.1 hypothetical protein [Prochlorococcus marinus CUG1439]
MAFYSQRWSLIFSIGAIICLLVYLMEEDRKKLEKIYQELKEDTDIKKWNHALIPKAILLFPPIAFALTFLKINTDKSIIDLLVFVAMGGLLVFGGIFLNFLLSKGK